MKTVAITGSGSGLGLELAKIYGKNNYHLILLGRSEDKLLKAHDLLVTAGSSVSYYVCDITSQEDLLNVKNHLSLKNITLDVLINNAGVGFFGPLSDLKQFELETMIATNLIGTILTCQVLLPLCTQRVLNIISTAGLRGKPNEAVYCASKFGVRGFTESLQKEYQGKLAFTAVYMGGMATPFWAQTDHIKDPSRLKSPAEVAKYIFDHDDGRQVIEVDL